MSIEIGNLGERRTFRGVVSRWFGTNPNEVTHEGSLFRLPKNPSVLICMEGQYVLTGAIVINRLVAFEVTNRERSIYRPEAAEEQDYVEVLQDSFNIANTQNSGLMISVSKSELNDLAVRFNRMVRLTNMRQVEKRQFGAFMDELIHEYDKRLKEIR